MTHPLPLRLKRLRQSAPVRHMLRDTHLHVSDLIAPIFINANLDKKQPINAMPGQYQWSLKDVTEEIDALTQLNIKAILLFGIPETKNARGDASLSDDGIIQRAIRLIRTRYPDLIIIADVCFCEYTDHGHCGVLHDDLIDNDATLTQLAHQAVSYAKSGADWIAPSSMTDGMVGALRRALDEAGYPMVTLLSYAVKYSSSFYGPFREAAQGAPQFGDRKTYQMDPANRNECIREAQLDINEGADLIMVKPAMNYLDIIYKLKQNFPEIPLCAYQVSGEFAMIKTLAAQGLINETAAIWESHIAMKRAGADLMITYFAKDVAKMLSSIDFDA